MSSPGACMKCGKVGCGEYTCTDGRANDYDWVKYLKSKGNRKQEDTSPVTAVGNKCDCGGEITKLPHYDWCSLERGTAE